MREEIAPYKALDYEDPDSYVFAGFIPDGNQRDYFNSENPTIYHIPASYTVKALNKLKYFCPIIDGIREFFEIREIKTLARKEIFPESHPLYKNRQDQYLVFYLTNKNNLSRTIVSAPGGNRIFRYARLSELFSSNSINDFNKIL